MKEAAIRTQGLTRNFGSLRAVDGVDLEVPAGSIFGFLGPNGAGKTTTLHLLLGLLAPTAGSAHVLGFDAQREGREIRRRVGALLEHHGLYERLDAQRNLEFYARLHGMTPHETRDRIHELLSNLGLWDRRRDVVTAYSRGMKQKLAVARALLHGPQLVFLDEPTAGQDPKSAAEFREHLLDLARREGVTVFLTTHNLTEAEKVCDRVAVIRQGKILATGVPRELRTRSSKPRVTIVGRGFTPARLATLRKHPGVVKVLTRDGELDVELADHAPVAPLVAALVKAGADVEEVRKDTASLEDFFLTLVKEAE